MTNEQFKALEPYEEYFRTAITASYARYPGLIGVQTIHGVYCDITGTRTQLNKSCSSCIFRLLVDCGTLYYEEKKKREEVKPKRKRKNEV